MATTITPQNLNESTFSAWAEATEEQRAHFGVPQFHRAWSRLCSVCGEGDLVQRKKVPSSNFAALVGHGFPPLPLPVLENNQRQPKFKTPVGGIHAC